MSDRMKETERIQGQGGPGRGPMASGLIAQKPLSFGASARRLLGRLRPHLSKLIGLITAAVVSVALSATGPRVLGRATDLI